MKTTTEGETMMNERMQVKCNYDEGRMHIQGTSKDVRHGRPYGFAIKMRTADDVTQWLRTQVPTLKSAASGETMYIPFDVLRYDDGTYQMFIPGDDGNHSDGAMLDLQPLDQTVKAMIAFANEANLTVNMVGQNRWQPNTVDSDTKQEEE